MSDPLTERIASLEQAVLRMEREIEIYRGMAIEFYHMENSGRTWEENTERVDREAFERMQRQGLVV